MPVQEQLRHLPELTADISALHVGKYFPPYWGGMENFLSDLLRTLTRDGLRTSALVHDHRPGLRGRLTSETVNGADREAAVPSDAGATRVYRVPSFGRLLYAPVSPQFPSWLKRVVRAERPDVLHLHLPNVSAFWALSLPEARRIPWVIHWHADVVSSNVDRRLKYAYPLYRRFEQRLLQKAEAVIVSSPPYLDGSRPLAPWRDKCRVAPLGLDPVRVPRLSREAREEAELSWSNAGFRILSVGRLTYYKGHEYLIEALKALPDARAVVIGEGQRRRLLEKTVSRLCLGERVDLPGDVTPERLHALMETCDCVCLPSIEQTEAFGLVLLEAMAHGKPSVVCDIDGAGMKWVVEDGETGLVVAPADPDALSDAFSKLAADRRASARMGRNGMRKYRNMFRIDRVGDQVIQLYREVLDKGDGR